ncbi:ABC transporter F family member 4-like isoform X2 [Cynoglossus semilaevis]|uniref:ABC transporter F family member 4-like isoform X2 n=1 Tax=Cynoglossus semilaevis TaxID=244447 RepID=UPI000D630215|nr:ABC transporter F family member 4-like isoform X2 [Cynoglossus semilaevis]
MAVEREADVLLLLIHDHLKAIGFDRAAELLEKHVPQEETAEQSLKLQDIYTGWLKLHPLNGKHHTNGSASMKRSKAETVCSDEDEDEGVKTILLSDTTEEDGVNSDPAAGSEVNGEGTGTSNGGENGHHVEAEAEPEAGESQETVLVLLDSSDDKEEEEEEDQEEETGTQETCRLQSASPEASTVDAAAVPEEAADDLRTAVDDQPQVSSPDVAMVTETDPVKVAEEATEAADDCDAAEQAAVSQTEATPPCTGGVEGEEGGAAEPTSLQSDPISSESTECEAPPPAETEMTVAAEERADPDASIIINILEETVAEGETAGELLPVEAQSCDEVKTPRKKKKKNRRDTSAGEKKQVEEPGEKAGEAEKGKKRKRSSGEAEQEEEETAVAPLELKTKKRKKKKVKDEEEEEEETAAVVLEEEKVEEPVRAEPKKKKKKKREGEEVAVVQSVEKPAEGSKDPEDKLKEDDVHSFKKRSQRKKLSKKKRLRLQKKRSGSDVCAEQTTQTTDHKRLIPDAGGETRGPKPAKRPQADLSQDQNQDQDQDPPKKKKTKRQSEKEETPPTEDQPPLKMKKNKKKKMESLDDSGTVSDLTTENVRGVDSSPCPPEEVKRMKKKKKKVGAGGEEETTEPQTFVTDGAAKKKKRREDEREVAATVVVQAKEKKNKKKKSSG